MTESILKTHADYASNLPLWVKVDDVCDGEEAVKEKAKTYLPVPITFGDKDRYKEYLERAVFYGVTGMTLNSYVGSAFNKLPSFNRPDDLDYLDRNADGSGRSIYQVSQRMLRLIMKHYRCAVYVDYPSVQASQTRAEDKTKNAYPMIHVINSRCILDWDHVIIGNQRKLSYVKIKEVITERSEDGFTVDEIEQYRILRLRDGVYTVEVYRLTKENKEAVSLGEVAPTDYNGKTWDYIPFTFVGAVDNSDDIGRAPLLELVNLNLAHYRNSADVEESGFIVGQPTYCAPNINNEQYELMKKEDCAVGARRLFPTEVKIVQAESNNLVTQLMTDKWNQMKEMGARLIEVGSANKTATQAENESSVQHSVVSLAVSNVSEALTMALRWCARFAMQNYDLDYEELSYTISQDFNKPSFSEERAKRLYEAAVAQNIPFSVWFTYEQTSTLPEDSWEELDFKLEQQKSGI